MYDKKSIQGVKIEYTGRAIEAQVVNMHRDQYIKHLTCLGDKREVKADQDIVNSHGVVQIKKGQCIKSHFYDRLVKNKLLKPLDGCVLINGMISSRDIVNDAKRLLKEEPELVRMLGPRNLDYDIYNPLGAIRLVHPVSIKLTVCREQTPKAYRRALRVAIIALFVAQQLRWCSADCIDIATAAVLHDLGMMHIETSFLENAEAISVDQHRQISAHPTIAFIFLNSFPAYRSRVSEIVHQHHERLDGSGYPKGLKGEALLPAARVLGAADLVANLCFEANILYSQEVNIQDILHFNASRFGSDVMIHIIEAIKQMDHRDKKTGITLLGGEEFIYNLRLLSKIIDEVKQIDASLDQETVSFLSLQIEQVQRMSMRAGIDISSPDKLAEIIHRDEQALLEIDFLVREVCFLIYNAILQSLSRLPRKSCKKRFPETLLKWLSETSDSLQDLNIEPRRIAAC